MADRTQSSIVVDAEPQAVLEVISDFGAYPEWTGAVKSAEVLETGADGRAKHVKFSLDAGAVRDVYTLEYDWSAVSADGTGTLSWTLVEANVLKALDGSYDLAAKGGSTDVTYKLTVDVRIPMLGMLRRKAEKLIIDTALGELKKRVES